MNFYEAIILGLVQGLTEFLPVSSSGHLVLVPDVLGWDQPSTTFDLVLHAGTLLAVIIYFRQELATIIKAFLRPEPDTRSERRMGFMIALGTVPAVIAGVLLENTFERFFSNPTEVAGFLFITGVMLIVTGTMLESAELAGSYRKGTDEMTPKDSLIIGLMQAAAIAPGISRSGSTIATGLFLGFNREAAARFSFLLSIPIIAGAAAFDLRHGFSESGVSPAVLATGFMVSAVVGFIAIKFLMNYIRKHSLKIFAYYCWAIGAAVIIWHLVR